VRKKSSAIVNFQFVSGWNDMLSIMLGLVSAFGYLKFLKLLKFNHNIFYISLTFKLCFGDLVSFAVIFGVAFASFLQAFYLIFNQDLSNFQSLLKTATSSFQMMLGKFEVS
jgi:hypothetical protein